MKVHELYIGMENKEIPELTDFVIKMQTMIAKSHFDRTTEITFVPLSVASIETAANCIKRLRKFLRDNFQLHYFQIYIIEDFALDEKGYAHPTRYDVEITVTLADKH